MRYLTPSSPLSAALCLPFLLPSFFHSVKGAFLTRSIVLIAPSPSTLRSFTTCINTAPLPPRAHGSVVVCVRGEREVLLLSRPFPRSRYRSHFRLALPFCEINLFQTEAFPCPILRHSSYNHGTFGLLPVRVFEAPFHASRIPSQSCKYLPPPSYPPTSLSPFFCSETLKFLKLHSAVSPVRHAIKWRQVEWKYQIDCKQKGSMFRQEGKSFRYSKNAALSL